MKINNNYFCVIVGAGIAGLVLAERISNILKKSVLIIEKRNHIGGMCYDFYDKYGFLVGKYGPHTFHTNDKEVFDYINKFCKWNNYIHRALSFVDGKFVHFPICKKTLEDLYGGHYSDAEALKMIRIKKDDIVNKFFKTFTFKQWGCDRSELNNDVISRIPFRNSDDDRYFTDKYQGNPIGGYTKLFKKMISNEKIDLRLNCNYKDIIGKINYQLLIYTGPIDEYFNYKYGQLLYRSVRFKFEHYLCDSYQPVASTRFPGTEVEYTRITEFKKMTGQKKHGTTILKEIPYFGDEPFYPYPTTKWDLIADKYRTLAKNESRTLFVGRLAEYRYYDMDDVVRRSLDIFEYIKGHLK